MIYVVLTANSSSKYKELLNGLAAKMACTYPSAKKRVGG
jgi:hypothetical protein